MPKGTRVCSVYFVQRGAALGRDLRALLCAPVFHGEIYHQSWWPLSLAPPEMWAGLTGLIFHSLTGKITLFIGSWPSLREVNTGALVGRKELLEGLRVPDRSGAAVNWFVGSPSGQECLESHFALCWLDSTCAAACRARHGVWFHFKSCHWT